jgi:hypothetical protein
MCRFRQDMYMENSIVAKIDYVHNTEKNPQQN